jgi:hypothetical protein
MSGTIPKALLGALTLLIAQAAAAGVMGGRTINGVVRGFDDRSLRVQTQNGIEVIPRDIVPAHLSLVPDSWIVFKIPLGAGDRIRTTRPKVRPGSGMRHSN